MHSRESQGIGLKPCAIQASSSPGIREIWWSVEVPRELMGGIIATSLLQNIITCIIQTLQLCTFDYFIYRAGVC